MAAKPDDLTLFADLQALVWYASDLYKSSPEALLGPVTVATIPDGEWRYAASGDLPPPSRELSGRVSQVKGTLSDDAVVLEGKGKSKKKQRIEASGARRYGSFLQAVPLVPADSPGQAVALLPAEDVEELLDAVSVSGKRLAGVAVAEADEDRALVQLESPPSYLIQRGALGSAKFLRKVPRKRILVEWGFRHPFEALLPEPGDASASLVVARSGHEVVKHGSFEGAGPGGKRWREVEVSPEEGERTREGATFAEDLALVPSRTQADPVVWMAEGPDAERAVVRALSRLREEELANVDVADLDAPGGRVFVVRELGSSRRGPRAIPRGRGAFAHVPGSRGVYVPAGSRLAPDLPAWVYERTFDLRPGEIALVEAEGKDLVVSKVPESAFVPALSALAFDAPEPVAAAPAGRPSPWAAEPWDDDGPSAPQKPPRPERRPKDADPEEGGEEDEESRGDVETMSLEEAVYALLPKIASSKQDVAKEERDALDKAFKKLPASAQALIQQAVKSALSAKPKRNSSSRDEARLRRLLMKALLDAGLVIVESAPEAGKSGGKKRKKADAKVPKHDHLADLERKLLESPEDVAAWLQLAQEYLAAGDLDEAVKAAEMAAWEGDAAAAKRAWEILVEADDTGAYAAVAKFAADSSSLTPTRFAEAANSAADSASLASGRRKRSRWLLNSAIAAVADDDLHAGRERDEILAELAARGISGSELPGLVRRRLLERYSAAEATGEAAEAAVELLDDMAEIADSFKSDPAAAEVMGETALHLASMGEATKAAELARKVIQKLAAAGQGGDEDEDEDGGTGRRGKRSRPSAKGLVKPQGAGASADWKDGWPWAASGLAKAGAALAIAQEQAEGLQALSTAIRWMAEGRTEYNAWEAAQHVIGAMAQAGLRTGDAPVDEFVELLNSMLEEGPDKGERILRAGRLIEDLGEEDVVQIEAVQSLGIDDAILDLARRMILDPDLTKLDYEAAGFVMSKFGGNMGEEAAESLLAFALSDELETYDSFTGEYLLEPALSAVHDPIGRAADVAKSEGIQPFKALMWGVSAARAAIQSGERPEKVQRAIEGLVGPVLEALEGSDAHEYESTKTGGGTRRNLYYLVKRLVDAVAPAFADDRKRGVKVVQAAFDRGVKVLANGTPEGTSAAAGLVAACVAAMAALGAAAEANEMSATLLDLLESAGTGFALHDISEAAAAAATAVDDPKLSRRLAESIKKASAPLLEGHKKAQRGGRQGSDAAGAIRAMAEAAKASAKAGDEAGAEAIARAAAKALAGLDDFYAFGVYDAASDLSDAAAVLPGATRYEIAKEVADVLKTMAGKTAGSNAIEVAKNAVTSGRKILVEGGAFKDAIAKWKGEDERRIRDRILSDCRPE